MLTYSLSKIHVDLHKSQDPSPEKVYAYTFTHKCLIQQKRHDILTRSSGGREENTFDKDMQVVHVKLWNIIFLQVKSPGNIRSLF